MASATVRLWHGTEQRSRDEERRRRLLEAALELYGTIGFRAATVQGLCKRAQVSTRSFYALHADQDEVLIQLYRELNAEILSGFSGGTIAADAASDAFSDAPLDAVVRALVEAALTPMLEDERKARVLEVESVGVSPALEQERRRAYRAFAAAIDDVFASLAQAGRIRSAPGGLTSLILVGGITEALVQRVQTEPARRTDAGVFLDEIAAVILRVISH